MFEDRNRPGCSRRALLRGMATVTATLPGVALRAASSQVHVTVLPDAPVGDPKTVLIEPCIAAHSSKPGSILVSAAELAEGGFRARAFASSDAGRTWTRSELAPTVSTSLVSNNWVAFGLGDTAF